MIEFDGAPPGTEPPQPTANAGRPDGATVGMLIVAIVGVLIAMVVLWLTSCDVDVVDRLLRLGATAPPALTGVTS